MRIKKVVIDTNATTKKKILTSEDLINGFRAPNVLCGQFNETYVWRMLITKPGSIVPVWLLYHNRVSARLKRIVRGTLKNIRDGRQLDENADPKKLNLIADIHKRSKGLLSSKFFDIKSEKGCSSLAFLAGCGYEVDFNEKELPEKISKLCSSLPNSGGDGHGGC